MADSNLAEAAYVKETTFGTTPSTPTLEVCRINSHSLGQEPSFIESAEIVSTADIRDIIRADVAAGGSIAFELFAGRAQTSAPYGFPDDFLLWMLRQTSWSTKVTSSITCTVESIATSSTDYAKVKGAAGITFVTDGWLVNQWGKLSGMTGATNNAYFKVISVAELEMEVLVGNKTNDFTDSGPTASVTAVQGSQAVNGTTLSSASIEGRYKDLTTADYAVLVGMTPSRMTMGVNSKALVTGSFDFLGKNESSGAISGSSDQAAATNKAFNTVDHVLAIHEGKPAASAAAGFASIGLTNFDITLDNGLFARSEIALLGAESIGGGAFKATGNVRGQYKNKTFYDKFLNATETQFSLVFDRSGLGYVFEFPGVTLKTGKRVPGGQSQDVLNDFSWQASREASEGITCRITRFF